jgi:hypothetical protein
LVEYCPSTLEHLVSLSPDQAMLGAIISQVRYTVVTCGMTLLTPGDP